MNTNLRLVLLGAQIGLLIELARRSPFCRAVILSTLAALIIRDLTR